MARMNINFFLHDEKTEEFAAGDTIFNKGDFGENMYGIQSGEVDLVYQGNVIKIQHQPMFALFVIQTITDRLRQKTARGR